MSVQTSQRVAIAGAGIAGLTTALAFARKGADVLLFERSATLSEVGAGLQLSPNATRILRRLGVLDRLEGAVRPPAVLLRDAASLREIARVPLGPSAEARWGAPYLVVHRADLQRALVALVAERPEIVLRTGATVERIATTAHGVSVFVSNEGRETSMVDADLVVGADGVWSRLRQTMPGGGPAKFAGQIAWRRTIPADPSALRDLVPDLAVGAFLNPRFHLVCYPIRGGRDINLVAFTPGRAMERDWSTAADPSLLVAALKTCAPPIAALANDGAGWTAYPLHTVAPGQRWTAARLALIGDAAHALTPFAAQGAAMAIEDAGTLAATATGSGDIQSTLAAWEAARRPRLERVRRRGAINAFAWHAYGPVAIARNAVLALMPSAKLAADLDWLYGWDGSAQQPSQ